MNGRLRLLCVVLACSALVPVFMAADSGAKVQRVRVAADPKTETDKFAWEVFVSINASTATEGNNNVVWETWADQDLVYGDPNHTPVWPGPAIAPLKIHRSLQHILATTPRGKTFSQLNLLNRLRTRLHSDPQTSGPAVPKGGEEVRMNKPTFDFIVGNNLWYIQGQQAAFKQSTTLSFPVESKEIKAFWKVIGESDKPRYHWQVGADGQTYGLIALHLMTRDLPNWVWATWEHVDNPRLGKERPCKDTFGIGADKQPSSELLRLFRRAGMGPEWESYRLVGTQIDFTDSTNSATLLGNSEFEGSATPGQDFLRSSSCITCHARSAINGSGSSLSIFKSTSPIVSFNGKPDPNWFASPSGTPLFLQRDFVWSLLLAGKRTAPPP